MPIYNEIAQADEPTVITRDGKTLYTTPPKINKGVWTALGEEIVSLERQCVNAPHDQVITLRLDITCMSTLKKHLMNMGIFTQGWSDEFARIMQETAQSLATKYNARWAYTQSDEITLIIVPTRTETGEFNPRYEHPRAGKLQKLVSLAAAHASAIATAALQRLRLDRIGLYSTAVVEGCERHEELDTSRWWPTHLWNNARELWQRGFRPHKTVAQAVAIQLANVLSTPITIEFDCRMAVWTSEREAFKLILWRAYDCGVNGVSDACHNQKGRPVMRKTGVTHNTLIGLSTWSKLKWLEQVGLLPLPDHQAHGTLYRRVARKREAFNPKTSENVTVMRNVLERVPGSVINLVKSGEISFPE
jgi:tRNA(His) 5'-end guanylyltransferase